MRPPWVRSPVPGRQTQQEDDSEAMAGSQDIMDAAEEAKLMESGLVTDDCGPDPARSS